MQSSWTEIALVDICQPKQWPTISMSQLTKTGHPVYGANGKIGFYPKYNHEKSTLLITCRGATCGELNISEPFSYITGNAMALDNLAEERVNLKFLYYTLRKRGLHDTITGTAQPQITREGLASVTVFLPPFPEQRRLAALLDKADRLRRLRRYALELSETYLQSVFLEMFGDPVKNPKHWDVVKIEEVLSKERFGLQTGPFGSSLKRHEYVDAGVPVWGIDNLGENEFIEEGSLFITREKYEQLSSYAVDNGDVLVSRAGTVGRMCVARPRQAPSIIGTNLIRIALDASVILPEYISSLFSYFSSNVAHLKMSSDDEAYSFINPRILQTIEFQLPPIQLQAKFYDVMMKHHRLQTEQREALRQAEMLFGALLKRAFEGEL